MYVYPARDMQSSYFHWDKYETHVLIIEEEFENFELKNVLFPRVIYQDAQKFFISMLIQELDNKVSFLY